MEFLNELKYSKDHEWIKVEGNKAYIGITDFAQHSLGDIVFVELPEEGAELNAGDTIASIESVKSASDVYMPIGGTIIEVNTKLEDAPQLINEAPYENYIVVIEMTDSEEIENLLDVESYKSICEEEE